MRAERFIIFFTEEGVAEPPYFAKEKESAAPTINRKKGKTRSVGVAPCHAAWRKGENIFAHDPGLLTKIIPAIVIPRKTSSAI